MSLRVGLGIDTHRLAAGRRCRLGGIDFDSPLGPVGHSDGDAVLHAACDACLSAAGLDDLGTLFADDDARNANRDSAEFCTETLRRVQAAGYRIESMDFVVETELPKLKPYRAAMRARIATLFAVQDGAVNIKGKTGEGVGIIGRGEALRVTCVALLARLPRAPSAPCD